MALLWAVGVAGGLGAQAPDAPQTLPPTVIGVPRAEPPASLPVPVIRNGAPPKSVEQVERFDPAALTVTKSDGRYTLTADKVTLRDFGFDRASADETRRVMQELGVNEAVSVPGSRPPFQVWLRDGKPSANTVARQVFLPVTAATVRAEAVGGVWVVTDGARGFFDFGTDAESAKVAAAVLTKHGFNQMGMIGSPRPVVLYPLFDRWAAQRAKLQPAMSPSPLGVLDDVAQKNLILPGNVPAGPKTPLDPAQLQVVRGKTGEWAVMHNDELLGRFGSAEFAARGALKAMQDAKVNQVVRVGAKGVPIFFADGQPMHSRPLGGTNVTFRPDRLKVQQVRGSWWLAEENRPLLEGGTKADAELLLKTIQHLHLTMSSQFGFAETGEIRFLTVGY